MASEKLNSNNNNNPSLPKMPLTPPSPLENNNKEWTVESALPAELIHLIPKLKSDESDDEDNGADMNLFMLLSLVQQLKRTKRTGWLYYNITDCESIADHMYRMGIMGFLANSELDNSKCIKIALVHDIAESVVGDITPFDGITKEEKHYREYSTIVYLRDLIKPINSAAAEEIFSLWNEYENITSPEARFVKDCDKFEFMVQCLEEEKRFGKQIDMGQCMEVYPLIKTPMVKRWANKLIKRRDEYWSA